MPASVLNLYFQLGRASALDVAWVGGGFQDRQSAMDGGCRSSYRGEAVISAMYTLLRRTPNRLQAIGPGRLRLLVRGPENRLRHEPRPYALRQTKDVDHSNI